MLIDLPDLATTVGIGIAGATGVAVVEEDQRVVVDEVGVVLVGEPRVGVRGVDREIAALAESPDDVAIPLAVLVVDLEYPVLVADGHDQVPVLR